MVVLTPEERKKICIEFSKHLPKVRDLLGLSQKDFGARCGVSMDRISRIENGHIIMTWSQLTSFLFVCAENIRTKEYLFANNVLSVRFLQYIQQKDENIPPDANIVVRDTILEQYRNQK